MDLQAQDAPSAKDHTRQPQHPSPYGYGPAAPHQAQTLRRAEQDSYKQQQTSPRGSEDTGGPFADSQRYYDQDDELEDEHMNHLHGPNGTGDHDRDYDDGEASDSHDEDMDDDMMDKISSSPSIEDGKYSPPRWPPRSSSREHEASPASSPTPTRGISPSSSSPFLAPPVHFPLPRTKNVDYDDHHPSKKLGVWHEDDPEDGFNHSRIPRYDRYYQTRSPEALYPEFMTDEEIQEVSKYLLPTDDPLLEDFYEDPDEGFYDDDDDDDDDWMDEDVNMPDYQPSSDDEPDEFTFTTDARFLDSGWGGECLREIEDIDFEFVYALHTFVATVEGQANATKGDTMVLLDDSNSYWWLVRVVKDGSIGYLPAEHIETPTERLARLNKHRNIDLSASMLGDNAEKSKNPLKKAMRRRNAKTVQFAPPTYYEPSEGEYSDEDEADDGQMDVDSGPQAEDSEQDKQQEIDDASSRSRVSQATTAVNGVQRSASNESLAEEEPSSPLKAQVTEPSQTLITHQDSVSRSRKGVVRNTDSFFKDDSVETKKISLTPRLLRGDSDSTASAEAELRQRPSLDNFDKMIGSEEKPVKEEKKKEKKGMLSGLFKRKEKPSKGAKGDDTAGKVSEESLRPSTHSKDSLESVTKTEMIPERKPSKLQKHPPATVVSPKSSPTESRAPQPQAQVSAPAPTPVQAPVTTPVAPTGPAPAPPTVRQVQTESSQESLQPREEPQQLSQAQGPNRFPSLQEKRSNEADATVNPTYSQRVTERFALDASESEEDQAPLAVATKPVGRSSVSPLNESQNSHRRNDSGMQISPIEAPADLESSFPETNRTVSDDFQENEVTPIEAENTASTSKASPSTATTHTPSTSRSTPTWSDASLRTYMENDQDIKDLLIIVHDKSNVMPVGQDHPLMANLFSNERSKLAEMQTQLDSMLMTWVSRKNASLLSR
ncbi:uncharacterized protein HMPREF1541_09952 [Cyphellophora europaea CBS 101466]|uniref:SH3 domain-containing protein n=1 Tax=Cyphellophora europaea (strain CBS 101466) TaxID=1220924 RepID=W2S8M7_CYPE1|nr:uncharacterized protein HMPREF1541_09952 [Cyphellophora europaea CBS 101466]ETN45076.1 hypothetical protein HMPREF1541_09952 [Cyphellophora europaea CBS 101466]